MVFMNYNSFFTNHGNVRVDEFEYDIDCYSKMCCWCLKTEENIKVTSAQNELLL